MQAIILAAGRGNRLREFNPDDRPKCLLEFGGRSLLSRQLAALADCGVGRVTLVVGHEADRILDHVGTLTERPDVSFAYNPRFLDGSVISLETARDALMAGQDTLVMNSDVLFHPQMLHRLVNTAHANAFLVDSGVKSRTAPVKIALRDRRIVEFRSGFAPHLVFDSEAESVGLFRFEGSVCADLAHRCAAYDLEGLADAPYEEALRDLVLSDPGRCAVEDIKGLPWQPIDVPEDIERAVKDVLPAIDTASTPGA